MGDEGIARRRPEQRERLSGMVAPRSSARRRATRNAAEATLAEALTALRRGSGLTMDEFESRTGVSKIRMQLVESGYVVPDLPTFAAYLGIAEADSATRTQLEELRTRARSRHTALDTVVACMESDRTRRRTQLDVDTNRMLKPVDNPVPEPPPFSEDEARTRSDVRYSITKPAWRRQNEASQADPALWPDPGSIDSVADFTAAMERIKSSTGMSYEALAQASKRNGYPLARSTVHALCTKPKLPNSKAVGCFIQICGGTPTHIHAWNAARQRLAQGRDESSDEVTAERDGPMPGQANPALSAKALILVGLAWLSSIAVTVAITWFLVG